MAPTEITQSSPNQQTSKPESSKADNKHKEPEPKPKTDPSTTEFLRTTVSGADKITDPSTEKHLREAT